MSRSDVETRSATEVAARVRARCEASNQLMDRAEELLERSAQRIDRSEVRLSQGGG